VRLDDFDYELPAERIAQAPPDERDGAKLYLLPRDGGEARHAAIVDLPSLLPERALLVVNDSRVFPARLRGRKETGGKVELLLLHPIRDENGSETWACLGGASKPLRSGMRVFLDGEREAEIVAVNGAEVEVRFASGVRELAERIGEVPLPPYIERVRPSEADRERYQTVYARDSGSAAAPTAGLHLSERLLARLDERGIERAAVTLHVGLGTFAPLRAPGGVVDGSELHAERYVVPEATAAAIARARGDGRAVVAVGTTTVRTLESACDERGLTRAGAGETRLFIRPGHRFRAVDGMLTNFHLPRSSLLMLVAAFGGRERVLAAYRDAVARRYRFYSFGDAMLLI